jgi:hypothetical protein
MRKRALLQPAQKCAEYSAVLLSEQATQARNRFARQATVSSYETAANKNLDLYGAEVH